MSATHQNLVLPQHLHLAGILLIREPSIGLQTAKTLRMTILPVHVRRAGRSLASNLLPTSRPPHKASQERASTSRVFNGTYIIKGGLQSVYGFWYFEHLHVVELEKFAVMVQNRPVTPAAVDRLAVEAHAHTIQHPSAVGLIRHQALVSGPQGTRAKREMSTLSRSTAADGNVRHRRPRRAATEVQGNEPPIFMSI